MKSLNESIRDLAEKQDNFLANFVSFDDSDKTDNDAEDDVWTEFCGARHLIKLTIVCIALGIALGYLMCWNDIIALYIEFALLLVQLVFTIDKLPSMRLDTRSYLRGPAVAATLDETELVRATNVFSALKKPRYVVTYTTNEADGSVMTIRKTLQPGFFDKDLIDGEICDTRYLTDLVCKVGAPFSAFPRKAVKRHIGREKKWILYFMPILVVTFHAILFNLFLSYHFLVYVPKAHTKHVHLLTPLYIIFGVLYAVILFPLAFGIKRWVNDVHTGGEVISTVGGSPNNA